MTEENSGDSPRYHPRTPSRKSPHFFTREPDGSARFRIRLSAELASLVEEAAGETPLMLYLQRIIKERAEYHKRKRNENYPTPPIDEPDPEDLALDEDLPESEGV